MVRSGIRVVSKSGASQGLFPVWHTRYQSSYPLRRQHSARTRIAPTTWTSRRNPTKDDMNENIPDDWAINTWAINTCRGGWAMLHYIEVAALVASSLSDSASPIFARLAPVSKKPNKQLFILWQIDSFYGTAPRLSAKRPNEKKKGSIVSCRAVTDRTYFHPSCCFPLVKSHQHAPLPLLMLPTR